MSRSVAQMNKFNKPSGRTAKRVKRDSTKKIKQAAGVPQARGRPRRGP